MPNPTNTIREIVGESPADLVQIYAMGDLPSYPESRICFLSLHEAAQRSREMTSISVVQRLGLWFLDDANDSNPFAYITRGPCRGMILHFSHDLPELAFASLTSLIRKMRAAGEAGEDINDIERDRLRLDVDSDLAQLAGEESEDAQYLIGRYLPICTSLSSRTVDILATHSDFFVREDLAEYISSNPDPRYLKAASQLAEDRHPQVVRPGRLALNEIRKKTRG